MAYNQHEHVELGPFTGGVRFDKAREDLEPNELAYCRNGRLDAQGRLSKRPGITRQQDYSGTVHLLGEFEDTSGTRHNFAVVGAVFYGGASNQNDRTGALTVGGATTVFTNANGTAYFADGTNAGYKWAGETNNIEAWSMPTSFTKPEFVIFWDNRLWCASDAGTDEDIVWRSQAGGYETWEGSYTLGQKILALSIHQDQLLAHTETGMWQFTPTGDANTPYELEQVAARGVVAKRGVVTYSDGSSIGVFRNGIYRWEDPRRLEKVSHALDIGYWEERYGKHSGDSPANIDAVYYPTDEEVWFTFGGNSENIDVFALREIDGDWVWMGPWQYSTDVVVGSFTALGLQSSNRMRAGTDEGEIFSMDPNTAYQDAAGATIRGVALQAQTALASAEDEAQGRWAYARHYVQNRSPKTTSATAVQAGCYMDVRYENFQGWGETERVTLVDHPGIFNFGTNDRLGDGFRLEAGASFNNPGDTGPTGENRSNTVPVDTRLRGNGTHVGLTISNGIAGHDFVYSRVVLNYKKLGRGRRRRKLTTA